LDGYPASYGAGYPPENPAGSGEDCLDSNSASHSADCPDNRPGRNPESNRESNGADCSDSYSVDSPPDYSRSYPESFDPGPVNEPTQVQGPNRKPDWQLPRTHHRVHERRGDNGTGLSAQGSTCRRNRASPRAAEHRPSPPPPPRRHGLHSPRPKELIPPSRREPSLAILSSRRR